MGFAGPASMQMTGIQVVQVQPRRAPRKPKIQPLTAQMIERLPSFFLETTAKVPLCFRTVAVILFAQADDVVFHKWACA